MYTSGSGGGCKPPRHFPPVRHSPGRHPPTDTATAMERILLECILILYFRTSSAMEPSDNRSCPNLYQAVDRRHSKCLKLLIADGANVNEKIDGNDSILMKAVERCSIEDIRFLISAGTDVNATGSFGLTVLMIAAMRGRNDVIQVLAEAGADVNAADSGGVTALLHAAKHDRESSLMVLAEAGARLNVKSLSGETPLNKMVQNRRHASVKYLVEKGADVNYNPYRTALHHGVMVSNVKSIRMLLGAGADVNIPDRVGITPFGARITQKLALAAFT